MKSVLKSIVRILLVIFAVLYTGVAIFVTVCLLNFNDQRITELGDTSIVIVDDEFSEEYKKGDLLFLNKDKEKASKIAAGDYIFFYNPTENGVINYAEVNNVTTSNGGNYIFVLDDNYNVYYDYYIGTSPLNMKGFGKILSVLESQFGFLILIILPTMVAIIFEIYAIILEVAELKKEV